MIKKLNNASIVIFGAKGDLTRRKLIPALYNLFLSKYLPQTFCITCVDYVTVAEQDFKNDLLLGVNEFSRSGKADDKQWQDFISKLKYIQGDFLNDATYTNLKTNLEDFDKQNNNRATRMFYYAIAPRFIETVSEGLFKFKICNKINLDRIVIEKPFGTNLETAKKLNSFLQKRFSEKQIFRIDHYLGKETVQNIMAFRFANHIFEPLWNNKFIDNVQISLSEQVSVGKRGGYYDSSGALRDMVQNHLMQLLCVVAMECPKNYLPETIRNAKLDVLKKIKKYTESQVFENIIRGQYTESTINNIKQVSYRKEENVAPKSNTETFVAAKLLIENNRWKGVPFYLRTGKCLPKQSSVITIQFKQTPHKIFKSDIESNKLVISIQPEQEISLTFESKIPGLEMKLKNTEMDFTYKEAYSEVIPEAYEALLLDVLEGDATLFMRADQVEAAWKVVMPIINAWQKNPTKLLHFYKAGTWGPLASKEILKGNIKDWNIVS